MTQAQPTEAHEGRIDRYNAQEIEARLRSEIEIEVRREFLSQLTGEVEESSHLASTASAPPVVQPSPAPAPTWSPTVMPMTPVSPQTAQIPASTPSLTGDFGEEAAEIFRLEAEEHLQTISMFVAALVLTIVAFIPMAYFVIGPVFGPVAFWFFHLLVAITSLMASWSALAALSSSSTGIPLFPATI